MATRSTGGTAHPLSRDRVVAGGVALADADGLPAVTMRKLASSIGSEPMSLYRHVQSKDDLLDGMVDAVADEVELDVDAMPWPEAVTAVARSAVDALDRHPWAAARWLRGPIGPGRMALMEALLAALQRSGRADVEVDGAFHAIVDHVVGAGVARAAAAASERDDRPQPPIDPEHHPHLVAHVRHHEQRGDDPAVDPFDLTLAAILDTLRGPGIADEAVPGPGTAGN